MFVILEGIDKSGKSTVAELYRNNGYHVVHMRAPDKKYSEPGYTGPGYVDEILDIYMKYDGKDVVFDRSAYGEIIWPHVYDRAPQLTAEDLDILIEFEERNHVQRFLMIDDNTQAHWQRCMDHNEPLTKKQFLMAGKTYMSLVSDYGFTPKVVFEFKEFKKEEPKEEEYTLPSNKQELNEGIEVVKHILETSDTYNKTPEQIKLEKANAINSIMSSKIIKKRGDIYDELEDDIRSFLNSKLAILLGSNKDNNFSQDEIQILKLYCDRVKIKLGENNEHRKKNATI